jgi:hypothetical protein
MKTTIIIGLLAAVNIFGCSRTTVLRTNSPEFAKLQQKALGQKVRVTLKSSQFYENVELMQLIQDSVSWAFQNEVLSMPTQNVAEFRFLNRHEGAREGFAIGLLTGILTGAIISSTRYGDVAILLSEDAITTRLAYFGGFGALMGLAAGAAQGSEDIYLIEHESSSLK